MQQSKFRTHSLACSHRLLWPLAKTNSNLFTGFLLGYLRLPGKYLCVLLKLYWIFHVTSS